MEYKSLTDVSPWSFRYFVMYDDEENDDNQNTNYSIYHIDQYCHDKTTEKTQQASVPCEQAERWSVW